MGIPKKAVKKNGRVIIGKSGTEYHAITGCTVCSGPLFPYKSEYEMMEKLYHCFLCGRFHLYVNSKYELWMPRSIVRKNKEKTAIEALISVL